MVNQVAILRKSGHTKRVCLEQLRRVHYLTELEHNPFRLGISRLRGIERFTKDDRILELVILAHYVFLSSFVEQNRAVDDVDILETQLDGQLDLEQHPWDVGLGLVDDVIVCCDAQVKHFWLRIES